MKFMPQLNLKNMLTAASIALSLFMSDKAVAASGEMGTGYPAVYGVYSSVIYPVSGIVIWQLTQATTNFPAGCSYIKITKGTMGADEYKNAMATLLTARTTNKKIRFYAHTSLDGGCGVDYVQLVD